jgi:hypothetical protein
MPFVEDTSVFLADFGVDVVRADGSTFRALHDQPSADNFDIRAPHHSLTLFLAAAPGIEEGEPLAVAGVAYTVLAAPEPIGDGVCAMLAVAPV